MPGLFQRLSTLVGSDIEKAADLAHRTFNAGLDEHGHHGRAFIESLAKLCREHPNLVGIGVGILVEQLLSEEKREHDRKMAAQAAMAPAVVPATDPAAPVIAPPLSLGHDSVGVDPFLLSPGPAPAVRGPARVHHIRPVRLALEVFGGLMALKFSHAIGRMFGKGRPQHDSWFTSAAKIHVLSASLATYCFASALHSPRVSAWRNAAIGLFGTDAIKPLLKPQKALRRAA